MLSNKITKVGATLTSAPEGNANKFPFGDLLDFAKIIRPIDLGVQVVEITGLSKDGRKLRCTKKRDEISGPLQTQLEEAPNPELIFVDISPDPDLSDTWIAKEVLIHKGTNDRNFVDYLRQDLPQIISKALQQREDFVGSLQLADREQELSREAADIKSQKIQIDDREAKVLAQENEERLAEENLRMAKKLLTDAQKLESDAAWCLQYIPRSGIDEVKESGVALSPKVWGTLTAGLKVRGLDEPFAQSFLLSTLVSLLNGRFLLLAGHVGVGKSSLVETASELLGGSHGFIAVRPGWLDPSDLLGYTNANGKFEPGPLTRKLRALANNDRIAMVLLDELNIGRIENYAADLLASLGPNRRPIDLNASIDASEQVGRAALREAFDILEDHLTNVLREDELERIRRVLGEKAEMSSSLELGENTVFCGTLNIDESTENLSPKMVDRSFLLRFPSKAGEPNQLSSTAISPLSVSSLRAIKQTGPSGWTSFEQSLNGFRKCVIPISHRVREDYEVFLSVGSLAGLEKETIEEAYGFSRILPRIRFFRDRTDESEREMLLKWLLTLARAGGAIEEAARAMRDEIVNPGITYVDFQTVCG